MHISESQNEFSLDDRRFAAPLRRNFAIVTAAILLPFAIVNAISGVYLLAFGTGLLFAFLMVMAVSLPLPELGGS